MRHSNSHQKAGNFSGDFRRPTQKLNSTISVVGGAVFLLGVFWMGGCSSAPKAQSDPSKQEVQADSDRFFMKMEKEEAKKEGQDAKP